MEHTKPVQRGRNFVFAGTLVISVLFLIETFGPNLPYWLDNFLLGTLCGLGSILVIIGFTHEGTMNSFRQTIGYAMLAFLMVAMAYAAVINFQELYICVSTGSYLSLPRIPYSHFVVGRSCGVICLFTHAQKVCHEEGTMQSM